MRYRELIERSGSDGVVEQFLSRRVFGPVRVSDLASLLLGLTFFLLSPFGNLDTIVGDNIAQVAYWRVLFNPHLVGSIGATNPKLGLMVILGVVNDVSMALFHSTVLLRPVCALFGAALSWVVCRIASDIEGRAAGLLAALFLLGLTTMSTLYVLGGAMLFFLPLVYGGIWLFSNGREGAGTALLCAAILVRLEAVGVIAWLGISNQLLRRNWRGFGISTLASTAAVAAVVLAIFVVQGSTSRLDAGAASTGYLFGGEASIGTRLQESLESVWAATGTIVSENSPIPLAVLAFVSVACSRVRRSFASLLGIVLFLMAIQIFGGGLFATRYFEFLIPFLAVFGTTGAVLLVRVVVCFAARRWVSKSRCESGVALVSVALAVSGFAVLFFSAGHALARRGKALYTTDAIDLLATRPIPAGSSVLIEDDITYGVVVREPKFFRKVTSLQLFNISDESTRIRLLGDADYVLVSKARYGFYYLRYDPLKRGKRDPFRGAVRGLALGRKGRGYGRELTPIVVYGRTLTPIVNSRRWLILRVEPPA